MIPFLSCFFSSLSKSCGTDTFPATSFASQSIRSMVTAMFIFLNLLSASLYSYELTETPLNLVSAKRADLMAKYIYAKHREWKTSCSFGRGIYYRHLEVWNQFWEYDPPKRDFKDFIMSFDDLLDSVKLKGFNSAHPIPLGSNKNICNGAHRLVSCLLYGKKIAVSPIPKECSYDFNYFKKRG